MKCSSNWIINAQRFIFELRWALLAGAAPASTSINRHGKKIWFNRLMNLLLKLEVLCAVHWS